MNQTFKLSLKNKSNGHNLHLIKQRRNLQEVIQRNEGINKLNKWDRYRERRD